MARFTFLWAFLAKLLAAEDAEDASNVIEVMAWCKGVLQGLDWPQVRAPRAQRARFAAV